MIKDIIAVAKDKTEQPRANAAVLLAKLAKDDNLKEIIRDLHGIDVLMSLRGALGV